MGTLFKQSERKPHSVRTEDLESFLRSAQAISKELKVSVSEVIEAKRVLELERRNELELRNGDTWDEQIAGIGEILQSIADALAKGQE